jgi:predicted cupin superfamily sugar epimerase
MRLPTNPPMSVAEALDKADGVYLVIKNRDSVILWANDNFARLVGESKEKLIGSKDERAEHVADDRRVMEAGVPLLNYHETITIPAPNGGTRDVPIVTQKGLLREKGGTKVIGITVCFSLQYPDLLLNAGPVPIITPSAAPEHAAQYWIDLLGLTPAAVGGFFASTSVSQEITLKSALPERFNEDHQFYSANYYLLRGSDFLRLHSLNQDELWFHHAGKQFRLHIFTKEGVYYAVTIGQENGLGDQLEAVVPHNSWFGAEVMGDVGYALAGCSLAPGYNPKDSIKPTPEDITALKLAFPEQIAVIDRLTA